MSILSIDSPTYLSECEKPIYYYESTSMRVSKEGHYQFIINSSIGIHAKVYKNYFYPMNPNIYLLMHLYGDCTVGRIKFTINLWTNETYYLIVATTTPNITYSYSVISTGPSYINFNQTSECYDPF